MGNNQSQSDDLLFSERLSSKRTQALFIALMLVFLLLGVWRMTADQLAFPSRLFLFLSAFFLFYVINYRTLIITLTPSALTLKFGLFRWRVPVDNIGDCSQDQISTPMYFGGAGIHFMTIAGRYRALFNFLEYPRVVIAFKKKAGPVRDISFSTRQPDELIRLIQEIRVG